MNALLLVLALNLPTQPAMISNPGQPTDTCDEDSASLIVSSDDENWDIDMGFSACNDDDSDDNPSINKDNK